MTTIRSAIDEAARVAVAHRTEELFRRSGALREGHFLLKSGRHSDRYLEKFAVLSDPAATSELCAFWSPSRIRPLAVPSGTRVTCAISCWVSPWAPRRIASR